MIRIEERYAVEKCRATSEQSRSLRDVYLDAEKKRVLSSNGHIIAIVPVECSDDEKSRYISQRSWRLSGSQN